MKVKFIKLTIALSICLMFLLVACECDRENPNPYSYYASSNYKIKLLKARVDSMTQERGHSWMLVKGIPDSIYFVSFNNDTTWYIKTSN